jgi:hypothetical protein
VAVDGGVIDLPGRFESWDDCWAALAPPDLSGVARTQIGAFLRNAHPDWPREGIAATLDNFARLDDGTVRPHLSREHHRRILRSMWERRPADAFSRMSVPVLLIPAEGGGPGLDGFRPDSGVFVRPLRGDHDLHVQQPQNVARLLLEALDEGLFG